MLFNRLFRGIGFIAFIGILSAFVDTVTTSTDLKINLPYKKMGLTKEQAAAHLLSRFSFGAKPGQVKEVVEMGLENWLQQQLDGNLSDDAVARRLPPEKYEALTMNNETIVNTYLNAGQIIRLASKNNLIDKDSLKNLEKPEYREAMKKLMEEQGYKGPKELQRQLINQKIIRAAYGQNQLQEVLTDFWFNHFNVSLSKGQSQQFVLSYERDAIRPNVLGSFENLLKATAKHPAMLTYLDNAMSVSMDNEMAARVPINAKKTQGLNENYAREIMELHTLGVEGGYTQKDVRELARVLTGWTVFPMAKDGPATKILQTANPKILNRRGWIIEGDFLFRGDKHDDKEKQILGKTFAGNGGLQEGLAALTLLANHPATAKFICSKIATRFVADTPSTHLVNTMKDVFLKSHGDIKSILIAMVNSKEFWDEKALSGKVKSPFELAISAVRATNANVQQPFQLFNWCTSMGQKFYFYQAPTGFPDKATYWINTGSLLNRMNFGLAFANEKIPGITVDKSLLNATNNVESNANAGIIIGSPSFQNK